MEVTKLIYILTAAIFFLFNAICLVLSMARDTKMSTAVAKNQFAVMACIFSFTMAITNENPILADIGFGLYYGCVNFSLYVVLRFINTMESSSQKSSKARKLSVFVNISGINGILLAFNFLHNSYYELTPYYSNDKFITYVPYHTPVFGFYLLLIVFISGYVIFRTVYNIINASRIYKGKYIIVLVFTLFVILLNMYYILFPYIFVFDYSLLLFQLLSIVSYFFSLYLLPNKLRKSMLSVANRDISDAVICYDYAKECIYINRFAQKIFKGNLKNVDWINALLDSDRELNRFRKEIQVENINRIFDVEFRQILDNRKKVSGYYIKLTGQTVELKKLEQEQYRSTHDDLTGLYNRSYFFSEMERILVENVDEAFILVTSNIRDFKIVNELFGAKFGDSLLIKLAEQFRKAKYENCIIGRISADKFAMLIPKKNFNLEYAIKNTESVNELAKDVNFKFLMELGMYEISNHFENVHAMYDKANLAIKNKVDEKQIVSVYDTDLMRKIIAEKSIINEFKFALEQNQFKMYLQPQINCENGKCYGAEALVRWLDLDGNCKQPGEFIPVLEKAGLIYKLDYYIWEKAAQKIKDWNHAGYKDYYISVNISVKDFYYADLYSIFTGFVEKYNISPKSLHLEITESVIIGDKLFHRSILSKLRNFGFIVEMDDFGSGYSSLNALKEMSMDVLKIDMGFISKTNNEERGKVIVSSIIKMAKALGMSVITEGVENQEQADFLKKEGSDVFQGYLFSKPIDAEEFELKYIRGAK